MIEFRTLGALELRRDGADVGSVLAQPKRLALLAYLCAASPRGQHARERLLALFWPESSTERARNSLRQALFQLRRSLGEQALVARSEREIGVDPALLWCDVAAFEDAVAAGRREEALALYGGEFMAGVFVEEAPEAQAWLEGERSRLLRMAGACARELSEAAANTGVAAGWARRALALDATDEAALRRLVALLDGAGETAAALDAFTAFERRLEEDYGLPPAPETLELVRRIRGRAPEERIPGPPVEERVPGPPVEERHTDPSDSGPPHPVHALARAKGAAPPVPIRSRSRRMPAAGVAAVLLVAALAGGAALLRRHADGGADGASLPTLAVLPFLNLSGDPEREFFSDGLSEELLNVLAQVPGMRVASRTSSFRYRGSAVPVDSIGLALSVGHVLEGSVREDGGRVRITAQLIDAATGYHLWSQTYDRDLTDLFAVQDEIARAIAGELRVRLGDASAPLVRKETADPEAHALVLRASYVMARQNTPDGLEQAESLFRAALGRDSSYARAYAGLASVRQFQAYRGYVPLEAGYAEARAMAERALALDGTQLRAHTVLARIAELHDWDFAAAEDRYRRAAELNPNTAAYLASRAFLLLRLGRPSEAVEVMRAYVALEPDQPNSFTNLGAVFGYAGRFAESLEAFRTALVLDPQNPTAHIGLAFTCPYTGCTAEGVAAAEAVHARLGDDAYVLGALGHAYAHAGRTTDAEGALARLRALPTRSAYQEAVVLAALGRTDEAFGRLAVAVDGRESAAPDMGIDPVFAGIRGDGRMRSLLGRMGL